MNEKKLIPACAYPRMSKEDMLNSIPIQKKRLVELAEREGYEIVQWYEDAGRSASRKTHKRTSWLQMLDDAEQGAKWEVILCYDRSRFSRLDSKEEAFAIQGLRKAARRLHTYREGMMDWESPTGRIIDAIIGERANAEAETLGYRTLEGRLNTFLKRNGHGQICPYGMARRVVDNQGQTHIVRRIENLNRPSGWTQTLVAGAPEEVHVVLWIFNTFTTKDVGYRALARMLNAKGIPSPNGKKWSSTGVYYVLRNEIYIGHTRFGRTVSGKFFRLKEGKVVRNNKGDRAEKMEGLLLENTHEGIVPLRMWDRAQEKIKRNANAKLRRPRGEGGFPLKGVLFCGHCRHALFGRNGHGPKAGNDVAYLCRSAQTHGSACGCHLWSIKEKDILPFVVTRLADAVDARLLEANSIKPPRVSDINSSIAADEDRLVRMEREISLAADNLLAADKGSHQVLDRKLQEKIAQKTLLEKKLEAAKQNVPSPKQILRDWQKWLAGAAANIVNIQTPPERGAKLPKGVPYTSETFRETMQQYGCRVTFWWARQSQMRWTVERVRLQFGWNAGSTPKLETVQPDTGSAVPNEAFTVVNAPFGTPVIDLVFAGNDLFPDSYYDVVVPLIMELRAKKHTISDIMEELNRRNLKTLRGLPFAYMNMYRLVMRLAHDVHRK